MHVLYYKLYILQLEIVKSMSVGQGTMKLLCRNSMHMTWSGGM